MSVAAADGAKQLSKPNVPCECRSREGKKPLGAEICIRRGGEMVTMRCELVLNNTAWREVGPGCGMS